MDAERREFLRWVEAEACLSGNTVAAYRRDLEDYARFLAARRKAPSRVRPHDVVEYLASLRESGRAEVSTAHDLGSPEQLEPIAKKFLGVSLDEITSAFGK